MNVKGPFAACLAAAIVLTGLAAYHRTRPIAALNTLERRSLDQRFRLRGERVPGDEVVLVVFDDRTQELDANLFMKRRGVARLIDAIAAARPAVIGIDAFFTDPEELLDPEIEKDIRSYFEGDVPRADGSRSERLLHRVYGEIGGDVALEAAIERAGNVVLAMHFGTKGTQQAGGLTNAKFGQCVAGDELPRAEPKVMASLTRFNEVAAALGSVTAYADPDYSIRALPAVQGFEADCYAAFSVQVLATYLKVPRARLVFLGSHREMRIGERRVPLARGGELILNFRGPAGSFRTISAVDVVEGRVEKSALEGKIVLVGFTYLSHDQTRTAFSALYPAVELHATAIDNILQGDWIRRAAPGWEVSCVALLALLVAALYWRRLALSGRAQIAGSLSIPTVYLAVTHLLFSWDGLWVWWVVPVGSCILVGSVGVATSYLHEGVERRRLRHAFAHYLNDEVISQLVADPSSVALGGSRRQLTVLFSDIRNFTSLSERLSPEEVVSFLNRYLTPMTGAVLSRQGLLDKYIGDAVMAVFGAPVPADDHASRGLACAIDMHRALGPLAPMFEELGAELVIGVGVNTGEMVVGNMGASERFDYTVVGDSVNLASRLEALTKTYGIYCAVGSTTREAVSDDFTFRQIDLVRVKGKDHPEFVYELLGGVGHTVASYRSLELFEEAVEAYRRGDFDPARKGFSEFAALNPTDLVAPIYLERLENLGQSPPKGWDGVFTHTSK